MHSEDSLSRLAIDLVAAGSHFTRATFQASGSELSYVALRVLAALEREPGLRVGELAYREGIAQPSMSQVIKRLVAEGLVAREPSPHDARASDLTITDAGSAAVREYRQASIRELVPVFRDLSPNEIDTLIHAAELLPRLTQRLRATGADGATTRQRKDANE